jgi:Patatin-like phospholipase
MVELKMAQLKFRSHFLVILSGLFLSACANVPRDVFTQKEQSLAQVSGYSGIRTWGDGTLADFKRSGLSAPYASKRALRYLAISGGGSAGAFGAGLLVGWSKIGTRPQFDMVSGVSAGALIAPFAFLGSSYDEHLTHVFTSGIASKVSTPKWLPLGLLSAGLVDPEPLRKIINSYVDDAMLKAVAREHKKGRRLLIVTTNMDAERAVVWDMGKISVSGNSDSLSLFREILVASASIPGAFPPVLLNVTAQGRTFSEMHADGGTTIQVFTVPEGVLSKASSPKLAGFARSELYVLINNNLNPDFRLIKNDTLDVASRGFSTIVKAQTKGSLEATFAFTKRVGIGFNLAMIDYGIDYDKADPFNTPYMRELYKRGYDAAIEGRAWKTSLPVNASAVQ